MNKILQLLFFCSELVLMLIIYAFAIVNAKSTCQDVIQYELSTTTSSLSKLEFKHSWIFWQAQNKGEKNHSLIMYQSSKRRVLNELFLLKITNY